MGDAGRPGEPPAEEEGEESICTVCHEALRPPVTVLLRGASSVCTDTFHMACFKEYVSRGFDRCPHCRRPFDAYARSFYRPGPEAAEQAAAARRAEALDEDHALALQEQEREGEMHVKMQVHVEDEIGSADETIGDRVRTRRVREALDFEIAQALQVQELEQAQEEEELEHEEESEEEEMDDTPCPVCKRPDDTANFLLCERDGCRGGGHTYCMGLSRVPAGTWLCPACRPPPTKNALRMRRFWLKRREAMGEANFKAAEARARKERRAKRAQQMATLN